MVDSGYRPDIVLAIARGGLLPGGAVAYALGVKNSCAMNVEFYTDVDYEKPQSLVKCNYVWRRTDRWIDFPWSSQPPVAGGGSAPA
ncbi:MAG: putative purine phosphoribosyltransferase [Conexibacter sp.]|nr:putative purine phosphoribosyltransferase [Conexibacter sp.]